MKISRLIDTLEHIAPAHLAESWDNVGLIVGDRDRALEGPTLVTIDLTPEVVQEALDAACRVIVSYHPPIFQPLRRLNADSVRGRLLVRAIEAGMAVYSPHTALDAVVGGMADWLADGLHADGAGSGDRRALIPAPMRDPRQTHKIVTFVPAEHAERVRHALASAGAGRIGEYELCSFTIAGQGTFLGSEASNPSVGRRGALETVDEVRLEMVCPGSAIAILIETLRAFHPYEEPAFDVYELGPRPDRRVGSGRRVVLDQPATPEEIARRMRDYLGMERLRLAEASGGPVSHVGVCPGSGAELIDAAIENECTLFVTGEMKHHELLNAMDRGCSVILAGHTNTERGYLPRYVQRINELMPEAQAFVSKADKILWRHV